MPQTQGPLLFLGSKPLGLSLLGEIAALAGPRFSALGTLDDTPDARGCLTDFRAFAAQRGLPLEVFVKPSGLDAWIDQWKPSAVIVCGWYWKIPSATLAKAPLGFIGLHASLLPRNRGMAPLVWSLLKGESETGVSLFYMEEGMDTGDLLAQERFPMGPDETIADALAKAEAAGLQALRAVMPALLEGRPPRHKQAAEGMTYGAKRTPEDGRIDWTASAEAVHNAIRAQTRPYPGAFALRGGRKLTLWSSARTGSKAVGAPGQVIAVGAEGAVVACGQGTVRLIEAQPEDEAAAPAGRILAMGERLA